MIGTLTLSISKFAQALIYRIILHRLCSMTTLEHSEPLSIENYIRVVALTLDLQRVSFYSATGFLHHSSIIVLFLFGYL